MEKNSQTAEALASYIANVLRASGYDCEVISIADALNTQALSKHFSNNRSVWLYSPSGTGKSWFRAQLQGKFPSFSFAELDDFGTVKGDSWELDAAKLPKANVYVGTADDADKVMLPKVDQLAIIIPSLASFHIMQNAKARDARNVPKAWIAHWIKWGRCTWEQYTAEMVRYFLALPATAKNKGLTIIYNENTINPKSKGWFTPEVDIKVK